VQNNSALDLTHLSIRDPSVNFVLSLDIANVACGPAPPGGTPAVCSLFNRILPVTPRSDAVRAGHIKAAGPHECFMVCANHYRPVSMSANLTAYICRIALVNFQGVPFL
jgi:hypothetical protein